MTFLATKVLTSIVVIHIRLP